jgi:hypothetical protein
METIVILLLLACTFPREYVYLCFLAMNYSGFQASCYNSNATDAQICDVGAAVAQVPNDLAKEAKITLVVIGSTVY